MFTRLLKFIILIGVFSLALLLCPPSSWAFDKWYPYNNPYSEIYGDINLEFQSRGIGGGDLTSSMQHDFIHYYNLGLRSYIWDPRLIQYDVIGRFYQDIRFGDVITNQGEDYYRIGGSGSLTLFPTAVLRTTLRLSRDMAFNPDLTITNYGGDIQFVKKGWPGVYLHLDQTSYDGDDGVFKQDTDYTHASLRFVHVVYFKPKKKSGNGNSNGNDNGNGNGNGEERKSGEDKKPITPNRLLITGSWDYYKTDNKINKTTDTQHNAQLNLMYNFDNNLSYILNDYSWLRMNDSDNFRISILYASMRPLQLNYSLSGFFNYSSNTNGGDSVIGGGLAGSMTKTYSPQWTVSAGVAGQFASGGGGGTSFGLSGFGGVFSRIFKDFDWGAGMSAGINTGSGDTNSNYALSLNALYRLAPNKLLYGDYTLSLASGDNQAFDSRLRLIFEGNWAPRFTLRSVAEFRLQNLSGGLNGGRGNNMAISLDNYGIYRISSSTTLSAGVNFAHISTGADTENDQRFRIYATLTSSPMLNLSYNVTTELNYSVKDALWNVSISPQVYYVWRRLYFSLQGNLNYFSGINNGGGGNWNYNLTFKVTRPFGLRF